ncbi:HAD family hydrolase [Patescibacteria group bacterium]|nr:HAD family hydrolase [Patescibacteria group bacterium]
MLEAITFDLWNTLICEKDYTSLRIEHLSKLLAKQNFASDEKIIREVYITIQDRWRADPVKKYRFVSVKERVEMILEKLGIEIKQDLKLRIVKGFEDVILKNPPNLLSGVKFILKSLYPKYRIGLVSDSGFSPGGILRRILQSLEILQFFSCTVFSDEVGYNKPNPLIFNRALKLLKVQPKETVHIGDLLETDIAGAKFAGMFNIWINRDKKRSNCKLFRPDYEINQLPELLPILKKLAFSL